MQYGWFAAALGVVIVCPLLVSAAPDTEANVVVLPSAAPMTAEPAEPGALEDMTRGQVLRDAQAQLDAGVSGNESPVYHLRPQPYSDEGRRVVTLQELLGLALDYNLALQRDQNSLESGHYSVDKTYYAFDRSFDGSIAYNRRASGAAGAAGAGGVTGSEGYTANIGMNQPLTDGSSYSVDYNLSRSSISTTGSTIPTTWGAGFNLGYTRPLLRGAGKRLNLIPRFQASNSLALGYEQYNDTISVLKGQVMDVWFRAVAAREAIGVREQNLEVALRQLERQVERYKVGLAIQSDLLQAENTVLSQRSALLQARTDYDALRDQLTSLVGLPEEYDLTVDASTALLDLGGELPEGLMDLVLANSIQLKNLQTQKANLLLTRESQLDRTKPQLNLSTSYGRTGEDTGVSRALSGFENENYGVQLNWQTTPHERSARADVAQTELDIANVDLNIQETQLKLTTDLRANERNLATLREQITLAENNVAVAQETLNIMVERNAVGLATTLDVIIAQQNVLAAELGLLNARVAYEEAYRKLQLQAGLL